MARVFPLSSRHRLKAFSPIFLPVPYAAMSLIGVSTLPKGVQNERYAGEQMIGEIALGVIFGSLLIVGIAICLGTRRF